LGIIFLLFISYLFYFYYWKRKNLPPGPFPLPFIGNLYSFRNNGMEKAVARWHKQYGDIMTVWIGTMPIVTVHDPPTVYETFLKDAEAYTGRYFTKGFQVVRGGYTGVILTDGDLWREHRRFALHVLRDFGLGKNLMQEKILDEVTALIADVKEDLKKGKKIISIQDEVDRGVGSIINSLTFGYRFGRDKLDEFQKNKHNIQKMMEYGSSVPWMIMQDHMDTMKYLPFFSSIASKIEKESSSIAKFYLKQIQAHRDEINFETDDEPTDFVEAFLRQQHKLGNSNQKDHTFTDLQLFGTIFDLWLAGQETTSTTLGWLFLYLIRDPEIQKKVHEELDRVVGSDRVVTLDDKNDLNYVNAVVAETQRFCNLVPFNLFHKTTKDVEIHGHKIPKDTAITHQIATIMRDERYFKNPHTFNPDRFIDENGKFFSPPELMPFGIGKRACLGEGLARMELFLFTANIFNQMRLKPAYGMIPSDYRKVRGTMACLPYNTEVELRY